MVKLVDADLLQIDFILFLSFCCRFTRAKKSSMMSVDLSTDLFVIFAAGPMGIMKCIFSHQKLYSFCET